MLKVLVAGDVEGSFSQLYSRVSTVNQKSGPFDLLIVAGSFFGPEGGDPPLTAPIPTLILGPTTESQVPCYRDINGCEVAENVTYLGRSGFYKEASGLRIAYLSGSQYDGPSASRPVTSFNFEDVKNLRIRLENEQGAFRGVDILLTHLWPAGVQNHAPTQPEDKPQSPSTLVALLAQAVKPRYHFAGTEDMNYERAPYRNHVVLQEAVQHPSRFISLAKVGNSKKKKWLYAFNITPMSVMRREELVAEPPNVTQSPYSSSSVMESSLSSGGISASTVKTAASSQFFYDTSYTGERGGRGRGRGRGGRGGHKRSFHEDGHGGGEKRSKGPPSACWFCLASPEVEKHLVVSIGDSAYVTLAKGGLTPDHLLILPIGHFQSLIECPEEVVQEITKFKKALERMFANEGKAVVFFERNFRSPHLQIQVVPLPTEKTQGLKITCLDFAEAEGIEIQEFPQSAELFQMTRPGFPYFFLELPDGTKLFSSIKGGNFPLQFGRELVASEPLLNCPEKVDWKECKMSKDEETKCTMAVRNVFKPFDFTLG